jgi:hypothetical protein
MLHFLIGVAVCLFIGERLVRWLSPRTMIFALGATGLALGGFIFLATILWPVTPQRSEARASTYQELIEHGRTPTEAADDIAFLLRTGATVKW